MSTIITTTELNTYAGETLDSGRAAQVVAAVNAYIENITGRSWGEVATATDETHDYAPVIFLRHQDVTEVTSVKRGTPGSDLTTLDATSYHVNDVGRLVLSDGRGGFYQLRDYVKVTYKYGKTTVPADLMQAALSLASDFYNYGTDGQMELSSEGIGSYQKQYKTGKASATGGTYWNIISAYRTRQV